MRSYNRWYCYCGVLCTSKETKDICLKIRRRYRHSNDNFLEEELWSDCLRLDSRNCGYDLVNIQRSDYLKKLELWKWSINEVSIDRGEYCALPGKFDAHLCRVEYESCKISAIWWSKRSTLAIFPIICKNFEHQICFTGNFNSGRYPILQWVSISFKD